MIKLIKRLKLFFTKPSMPFDKLLFLGGAELFLIILQEAHGRFYGLAGAVYNALFVTIILAVSLQLIRLINEVINDK